MKTILILITLLLVNVQAFAELDEAKSGAATCSDGTKTMGGGVDVWPWSYAKPFPWDNIQGFWKLSENSEAYLKARVLSTANNRKILALTLYGDGVCAKASAKGTGYVDFTEKNVVRAILSDGVYKYQLKIGMFDSRDIAGVDLCSQSVMAASMQVIERAQKSADGNAAPLDPDVMETHNMLLKKATVDPVNACKMMD
jgi:hypothetical protein